MDAQLNHLLDALPGAPDRPERLRAAFGDLLASRIEANIVINPDTLRAIGREP